MKLLTVYNTSPLLVTIRELKWTQSHIVTWLKDTKVKRPCDVCEDSLQISVLV